MKNPLTQRIVAPALLALALSAQPAFAQTAYWTNSAGGDWNTAANWDVDQLGVNAVPGVGINADIGSLIVAAVTYNAPMTAPSFAGLTLLAGSSLDVNAAGFSMDGLSLGLPSLTLGGLLNVNAAGELTSVNGGPATINAGGILNVAGDAFIASLAGVAPLSIEANGTLNVTAGGTATIADGAVTTVGANALISVTGGSLTFSNTTGVTLQTSSALVVEGGSLLLTNNTGNFVFGQNGNNAGAGFTNDGGTVILDIPFQSRGRFSRFVMNGGLLEFRAGGAIVESSNDQERQFLINGGVANLGDFAVGRTLNTVGSAGLVLSNGVVNTTSLRVGTGIAASGSTIFGGVLTNTGTFTISDRTNAANAGQRRVFFYIRGGSVYSTDPAGIIVGNQENATAAAASVYGGFLDINSGLLEAEGITLVRDASLSNVHGTLTLSGSGQVYLGAVGLIGNTGVASATYTVTLNGGTLGAKADYAINADGTLGGTFTLKAADANNVAHNVTHNGVWSGSGVLVKTGGGTLTINGANTYSGITHINGGTLALGAAGSIANSPQLSLAPGTTFDVSSIAGGYNLAGLRTLFGLGTVAGSVNAESASIINPGSNTVTGTLTIDGSLTQTGGAITHFDLSANPAGPDNDLLVITGDLNVSGLNTIEIVGGGAAGSIHPLIQYGGILNGTLAGFDLVGASGILTNNTATKTIEVIIESSVRSPASVTWVGNALENFWDVLDHTNWLNGAALDYFVTGDTVLFNSIGASHPNVTLVGNVAPAMTTVDSATDYAFIGDGSLAGIGGLIKTNAGTLTITTTNSYTGPTLVSGGVLSVTTLANGGGNSGIGAAGSASANLVLNGGTLRYTGASAGTDRAATLGLNGGGIDVADSATTLTLNGSLTGDGGLAKSGDGVLNLPGANSYTNGTTINAGTLALGNTSAAGTSGITNNGATLRVNGAIVIDNIVEFNGNANVLFSGVGAGNVVLRGSWYGDGIVNVNFLTQNPLQTFTIGGQSSTGGNMDNFFGTVDFGTNSGFLRINNDNSTFNFGSPNAIFDVGTGTGTLVQRNGGTTTHLGGLIGGPETRLAGRSSATITGTTTYSIGARNVSTVFQGSITNGASNTPTEIIKVGTGALTLSGTNVHTGNTTIMDGPLEIQGDNGVSPVTVIGGTLSGSGIINGPVTVQFGATLSPGSPVGAMTISNSLQLDFGSITVMELNKAAGTNDSVQGLLSLSYGGILNVTNVGGSLVAGDTFTLFSSSGGYFGAFEEINLPPLGPGLSWETNNLVLDGTISVLGVIVPEITAHVSNGNVILSGANGTPGGTYNILSSTNVAAPLSTWTGVETNVFDLNGEFTFSTAINRSTPQRFFILFVP
jgi:fibronectin-binding autotransporter adhesin